MISGEITGDDGDRGAKGTVPVMAHLVAGYPSDQIARAAARGLYDGGVSYFEVQFPFSDPSADGTAIQTACAEVLSRGWRLDSGFSFVTELRREYPTIPVFIMTYGNLAYKIGISEFVTRAAAAGASALIIPDLPFDADEGLAAECAKRGLDSVPVAAPSMTGERIARMVSVGSPWIYAALRSGITGASTTVDDRTLAFLGSVGAGGAKILGGFGVRTGEQALKLAPSVHAVVAGSVFVEIIGKNAAVGEDAVRYAIAEKARKLAGICL